MIKPYAKHRICIENFIYRFEINDIILYNKNYGFALIRYKDFCPINIQDDPHCLDFIYINENQRGKGHGKRLMKLILDNFQVVIHTLDDSLGFFEHISKDFDLEKINTGIPFGVSFISTILNINCKPVVNNCLGGCGIRFSGYKRHTCPKCTIPFTIQNIDKELIELNNSLRFKLKNCHQRSIFRNFTIIHIVLLKNQNIFSV